MLAVDDQLGGGRYLALEDLTKAILMEGWLGRGRVPDFDAPACASSVVAKTSLRICEQTAKAAAVLASGQRRVARTPNAGRLAPRIAAYFPSRSSVAKRLKCAASCGHHSGMVIVHGVIPIKPDRREEALMLAREVSEATQHEAGCVSYEFYVGLRDPNTLILLQEWESMEALSSHFRTKHTQAFMDALPDMLAGKVLTRRYTVQGEPAPARVEESPPIIH